MAISLVARTLHRVNGCSRSHRHGPCLTPIMRSYGVLLLSCRPSGLEAGHLRWGNRLHLRLLHSLRRNMVIKPLKGGTLEDTGRAGIPGYTTRDGTGCVCTIPGCITQGCTILGYII